MILGVKTTYKVTKYAYSVHTTTTPPFQYLCLIPNASRPSLLSQDQRFSFILAPMSSVLLK